MNSHINMNPMDGLEGDILPEFLDDKNNNTINVKNSLVATCLNWATEGALQLRSAG